MKEKEVKEQKRKEKKAKKKKHKSHKHKKNRKPKSSSESSSENEEMEWVEATSSAPAAKKEVKHEEWMCSDEFVPTFSKSDLKPERENRRSFRGPRSTEEIKPGFHERELNPYWKENGTGLPLLRPKDEDDEVPSSSLSSSLSGSSGCKWLKKGYSQTQKQSKDVKPLNTEASFSKKKLDVKDSDNTIVTSSECSETKVLTNDELNNLGAKLIKAEILGNMELAARLKSQLDAARKIRDEADEKGIVPRTKEVLLTKRDSSGVARPLYGSYEEEHSKKQTKNSKKRSYLDDSKFSLKQMFEREKLTTTDDHLEMFHKAASKTWEGMNDDYNEDDVSSKTAKRMAQYPQGERDIQKAIQEHKRYSASVEKCQYCLDQPRAQKHLIVTYAKETYLCLPPFKSLVDGHCLLVPKSHIASSLLLEDDEYREIKAFKRELIRMFEKEDKCVIFLENSMHHRYCPHTFIECIPMPKESGELAPLYFKKTIEESEHEWSHNKKLIDLHKKDLRHSVPKGLPYFAVEFGCDGGFAHIIEDEKSFSRNFGKEVIGGMLEVDSCHTIKNRREEQEEQMKKVFEFGKTWKKYEAIILNESFM